MASAIKVKAKLKNGVIKVKAMAKHEMSTYNQAAKKTGDRENANFITHISATCNGETVFDISTSQFLSKNPIFKYQFKGDFKKGDKVLMTYTDRKGLVGKGKGKIK
ncbi:thiosulfate oxidation carrier complex protein SoxZ [Sulfurimonas sp. SAG-AH-194-I05]|nr:thiosulfate oxidation carrier complex protein SoxZ [Sulfurimonas sp. SAG-AH-194-I05]MDF1875971.1 thiosulfate oxidation carrier complex protein SoxZ [Sulfurimonas sp. SAG-AH-194-I05]